MKKYGKFGALVVIIVGTLIWLATAGVGESKAYFKNVAELKEMKDAGSKRIRVGGDVEAGSIVRTGSTVEFLLTGHNQKVKVVYSGIDPLPDTFRDGAQALAEGKLAADGTFHATKIQAKCASKYGAKPGAVGPGSPTYQPGGSKQSL